MNKQARSIYEATRDRPETLEELITDFCNYKKLVGENIRVLQSQIDTLQQTDRSSIGRKAYARVLMIEDEFGKAIMDSREQK